MGSPSLGSRGWVLPPPGQNGLTQASCGSFGAAEQCPGRTELPGSLPLPRGWSAPPSAVRTPAFPGHTGLTGVPCLFEQALEESRSCGAAGPHSTAGENLLDSSAGSDVSSREIGGLEPGHGAIWNTRGGCTSNLRLSLGLPRAVRPPGALLISTHSGATHLAWRRRHVPRSSLRLSALQPWWVTILNAKTLGVRLLSEGAAPPCLWRGGFPEAGLMEEPAATAASGVSRTAQPGSSDGQGEIYAQAKPIPGRISAQTKEDTAPGLRTQKRLPFCCILPSLPVQRLRETWAEGRSRQRRRLQPSRAPGQRVISSGRAAGKKASGGIRVM
ncbi:uncharacterized protein LOC102453846 isoform X1 [Pelodiscus sinensis]|uniref:uncharacterized protein LOC102453846 isoform X1 n=1 Tax=Pelodiscus sinensis TaxID=13735 RepID=UPI003F6A72D7